MTDAPTTSPLDGQRDEASPRPEQVAASTRVGRYVVEEEIGRGGMGIVYRARDPTLDRPVALKLLRDRRDPQRLLREARALASLDHENVIRIHDAGVFAGRVFIAMELFEGWPLSRWVASRRPTSPQLAAQFVRIIDALCCAHARGIVHRDVKPANLLVDDAGALRVIDFGLARTTGVACGSPSDTSSQTLEVVTRNDVVVGTPAYMAPELLRGGLPSPQGDAWALGVTLYELTHDARPFICRDPDELVLLTQSAPTIDARLPRPFARAIRGLLEPDPASRMTLLAARRYIHRLATRRSRRVRASLLSVSLLGSLAAGVVAAREPPCAPPSRSPQSFWTESTRNQIQRAWMEQSPIGGRAWSRTQAQLTRRIDAWTQLRGRVCEAWPSSSPPDAREDARRCLDRALADLEVGVRAMHNPTQVLISRANEVLERLSDPAACTDADGVRALPPIPLDPDARDAAVRLRAEFTALALERLSGRLDDALRLAAALEADARALEHPFVLAELRYERGLVLNALGRYGEAEASLRSALELSLAPHHPHLRTAAFVALAATLGRGQKRFAAASELLSEAEAHAAALDDDALVERARLERAELSLAAEDFDAAEEGFETLLADDDSTLPRTRLLQGLAASLIVVDRTRARALLEEALEHGRRVDGEDHPKVAQLHFELGQVCLHERNLACAEENLSRARAVRAAAFGPDSTPVADIDVALGSLAFRQDCLEDARGLLERAFEVLQKDPDTAQLDLTAARTNLGVVYARLGHYEEAAQAHLWVRRTVLGAVGPDHPRLGLPAMNLASTYRRAGELERAIRWQREALRYVEIGPQHLRLRLGLAELQQLVGDLEGARASLAIVRSSPEGSPAFIAAVDLRLAELEIDAGRVPHYEDGLLERAMPATRRDVAMRASLQFARARIARARGDRSTAALHARTALNDYRDGVPVVDFDQRRVRAFVDE